jgi:hypothetical protein
MLLPILVGQQIARQFLLGFFFALKELHDVLMEKGQR